MRYEFITLYLLVLKVQHCYWLCYFISGVPSACWQAGSLYSYRQCWLCAFFNSVPFVCVHIFLIVNTLEEILFWGCTKPLCWAALPCPGALGAAVGRWNSGCVEALLSSAGFQRIIEIYQSRGKNQSCSNFTACAFGAGVHLVVQFDVCHK